MKSLSCYSTLQSAIKDPFLRAKVKFFISVSQEVEPFLRRFQSSKPLSVFLYKEYGAIIRNLAERVKCQTGRVKTKGRYRDKLESNLSSGSE